MVTQFPRWLLSRNCTPQRTWLILGFTAYQIQNKELTWRIHGNDNEHQNIIINSE